MSYYRPDKYKKTVVIPAVVVGEKFAYFYGGSIPKLREGTIINMVVPEYAIDDRSFLKKLEAGHNVLFLREHVEIFTAVKSRGIPPEFRKSAIEIEELLHGKEPSDLLTTFPDMRFVEIILDEPLFIQMRGTKLGRFHKVKCTIPALHLQSPAESLNHAYRLVSEAFEPDRISHAGNVFDKMIYIDREDKVHTLKDLRNTIERDYESKVLMPEIK